MPGTARSHHVRPLIEASAIDRRITELAAEINRDYAGGEGLVARPLQPYRMVIAAAPSYLRRRGHPRGVGDLARHDCLSYAVWQRRSEWILRGDPFDVPITAASLICSSGSVPALPVNFAVKRSADSCAMRA